MYKQALITIIATLTVAASFSQLKYKLPDATLTANQICGKKICDPGNVGKLLHYTKSAFSPEVQKATTAEEVKLSNNPFTSVDVKNVRFPDGRSIDYKRTEKLEINVSAAVDANIKELMKMTTDAAKIERLKAKITVAYSKVKGKELTVVGKYSEWQLSSDAREKMKKGDGFQTCRKWIEENNQRILLTVGIVYFEINFEQNSLDQLAAEIDGELAKEGLTGSLSFSFKREVTKGFKSSSEVYQILIVRHAGIKGKQFVETCKDCK